MTVIVLKFCQTSMRTLTGKLVQMSRDKQTDPGRSSDLFSKKKNTRLKFRILCGNERQIIVINAIYFSLIDIKYV